MFQNIRCLHSQNVKNQYFTCSWSIKPFEFITANIYTFSILEIKGRCFCNQWVQFSYDITASIFILLCEGMLYKLLSFAALNNDSSLLLYVTPVLSKNYILSLGKIISVSSVLTSECHHIKFSTPTLLYMTYFRSLILSINIVFVSNFYCI